MKLAFTISSYRLVSFVELGLAQLRKLSPDSPLLVSDDRSQESQSIEAVALKYGAAYKGSRIRRSHFGGDFQSIVNSIVFAEAVGADVAIKVSQRFIFRKPEALNAVSATFENENIMAATPGKPTVNGTSLPAKGFGAFSMLSDVVMIRVGAMSAEQLLHLYRKRLLREIVPWASFIEATIDELHSNVFPGRTKKIEELTNPTADPIYLRRYQATEKDYRDLALSHGLNGIFPLIEWGQIEGRQYFCRPAVI